MRQVVLDIETTGLSYADDRIVEIGCVELVGGNITGEYLQTYLNPGIAIPSVSQVLLGLTDAFLAGKPRFAEVSEQLISFLHGSALIIYNASFDIPFLNAELARCDRPNVESQCASILDLLRLTRDHWPSWTGSLRTLCSVLGIDNCGPQNNGALGDAKVVAAVYLEMTRRWGLAR